jgi:tRNA(Arg) A34 adenosine deaminase TadA
MTLRPALRPALPMPRRMVLRCTGAALAWLAASRRAVAQTAADPLHTPDPRGYRAALAMLHLARSWGDQAYGAVLVVEGQIVGEGPSRVVQRNDPTAHAEREAIRDAQRRLGRDLLEGSVLYSTSRPCAQCERVAAQAGVSRMIFGEALNDAGAPRP